MPVRARVLPTTSISHLDAPSTQSVATCKLLSLLSALQVTLLAPSRAPQPVHRPWLPLSVCLVHPKMNMSSHPA